MGEHQAPLVELDRVVKRYGAVAAVDGACFSVAPGEFFAMLGPSGSGKTTCLRLIAGFERADAGRVLLRGVDVAQLPPHERDVNTVFQDYALFPHMTVLENVSYGPRMRGVAPRAARERAMARLELVRLGALADRRPSQLSGGQRQRVALARALANEPPLLLLDEPLGALDQQLREDMQAELKALQRSLGIGFVLVTHDQHEALSMADRVAVFNAGRIEQLASPQELYHAPRSEFVARFVGAANVIGPGDAQRILGRAGSHALRPEQVRVLRAGAAAPAGCRSVRGRIVDLQFRGASTRLRVDAGGDVLLQAEVAAAGTTDPLPAPGEDVLLAWPESALAPLGPTP